LLFLNATADFSWNFRHARERAHPGEIDKVEEIEDWIPARNMRE
jgi:hypothetical protein